MPRRTMIPIPLLLRYNLLKAGRPLSSEIPQDTRLRLIRPRPTSSSPPLGPLPTLEIS